ncbi:HlyD family efflux transporter periplasmic adaptor subunit [Pseudomonas indica]|uniref:HlyD family efflux transporter periplasmic adaptor subunit n=1 Tax=Pseudomonas indica TaxID=137658 RepID=UPI0023F78672|nr:HlyD family efflux transporter periplasmic adaptor subunit [Pseudomonas indica]MBU3058210.1 HlyD family secretion protein [Pseudomonas indica]
MTLYRKEVLQAQSERLEGGILLIQSRSSWLVFWIVLALISISTIYLLLASYTKRTTAIGQLVPSGGAIFINAPSSGIIANVHVTEGQEVSAGDILFTLKDERYFSREGALASSVAPRFADQLQIALKAEEKALLAEKAKTQILAEQTQTALLQKIKSLDEEIVQLDVQILHHGKRLSLAKLKLGRHQKLVQSGYFAKYALSELEDNIADLQAKTASYQRERKNLQGRRSELEAEWTANPNKTDIALSAIEGKLSLLHQKIQERNIQSEVNIVAPVNGVVTGITALTGQATTTQPLAVLLAGNARLEARVYLSSREVGFIEPGQRVRLRFQAYPYQKFGQYSGTLAEVSQSPVARESLPPIVSTSGTDFYRATIKLDSQFATIYQQPKRLVSGMIVEADIEQDRRQLFEWILEPIYGFKKYN